MTSPVDSLSIESSHADPQSTIRFFARWYGMTPCERLELARRLQRERDIAKAEAASLRLILDRVQRQCPTATLSAPIEMLG